MTKPPSRKASPRCSRHVVLVVCVLWYGVLRVVLCVRASRCSSLLLATVVREHNSASVVVASWMRMTSLVQTLLQGLD